MDVKSENSDLLLCLKLGITGGLVASVLLVAIFGALFLAGKISDTVYAILMPHDDGFISVIIGILSWLFSMALGLSLIGLPLGLTIKKAPPVVFWAGAIGLVGAIGGAPLGIIVINFLVGSLGKSIDKSLIELIGLLGPLLGAFLGGFLLNLWLCNMSRLRALFGVASREITPATSDDVLNTQEPATKTSSRLPLNKGEYQTSVVNSLRQMLGTAIGIAVVFACILVDVYRRATPTDTMYVMIFSSLSILMALLYLMYRSQRLILSPEGVEYRALTFSVFSTWENTKHIKAKPSLPGVLTGVVEEELHLCQPVPVRRTRWMRFHKKATGKRSKMPLTSIDSRWRETDLGQEIKRYAPHLISKE